MAVKIIFYMVLSTFAQVSFAIDVCGLQDMRKCSFSDHDCLVSQEWSLRQWFQTPEARGYFTESIDPLALDELVVKVQHWWVVLKNVTIHGLANSFYNLTVIPLGSKNAVLETYIHNVTLIADSSSVINLANGKETPDNEPVCVELSNVTTNDRNEIFPVTRCTCTKHLKYKAIYLECKGGHGNISRGLSKALACLKPSALISALAKEVGITSTKSIYKDLHQFLAIVDYDLLYLS